MTIDFWIGAATLLYLLGAMLMHVVVEICGSAEVKADGGRKFFVCMVWPVFVLMVWGDRRYKV